VKLKPTAEEKVSRTQKPGIVIEQNPKAKEVVRVGTEVKLVVEVAPNTIPVPDVVGKPISEAKKLLKDFTSDEVGQRFTGKFSPGVVIEQNPPKDTNLEPRKKVALFVEAESVTVPDVIGVPADKVGPIFEVKKLQYYVIGQRIITGKVPVGAIAHQSPEKDQRVRVGTRVELAAEAESIVVPDLRGTLFSEVGGKLPDKLWLKLDIGAQPIGKQTRVGSQSPEPLTRVAPYTTIAVRPE
jgi:serine/threonine-protein kinase